MMDDSTAAATTTSVNKAVSYTHLDVYKRQEIMRADANQDRKLILGKHKIVFISFS